MDQAGQGAILYGDRMADIRRDDGVRVEAALRGGMKWLDRRIDLRLIVGAMH